MTCESMVACTNSEKADLLNASFINVAIPELSMEDIPETPCDVCPDKLLFTEEEVYNMLRTLDVSKSNGHDNISARILKETALSMTSIVTQLFNISIKLGELPDEWKVARVSPIPKSGKSSDPTNYRPISLLSILSKLLEKHMRDLLIHHFQSFYRSSLCSAMGFYSGKTDYWSSSGCNRSLA